MHKYSFVEAERVKRTPSIIKNQAKGFHITHGNGLHKTIAKLIKITNNLY